MKINEEKRALIKQKLDIFFEKSKEEFSLGIFSEIFDLLDDDFEKEYPEHYFYELKRIRDLYAVFQTAYEKGKEKGIKEEAIKQGIKEAKIEVAQNSLKAGLSMDVIMKLTGLTEEEIDKLKES